MFSRMKWLLATMKGRSSVRRVRASYVLRFSKVQLRRAFRIVMAASMLRIAEWFKAAIVICQQLFLILTQVISFSYSFQKVLQIIQVVFFFALVSSGFGAAISDAVVHSSIVFRNAVSPDRIVVAVSMLLGAAAACVILCLLQLDIVNCIGMAASRLRM